jgi:hypothetical protein
LQGCQNLKSIDYLANNPVPMQVPMLPFPKQGPPQTAATFPTLPPAPALPPSNPAAAPASASVAASRLGAQH